MKTLQEFKIEPLLEEEKSDYSKFDILVRAGLANKAQMQRIHRVLDKMTEDRPQFNNADRMIIQNLFNRMVDLITNNKQIFQKTRQIVREDVDTSDYKISPKTGRKVRAHRLSFSDINGEEIKEETMTGEPPFVLVLKRKAFRLYPNGMRVALYYNDKLGKYFSVPYSLDKDVDAPIQAENFEPQYEQDDGPISEAVMDQLHKIVKDKQSNTVKFADGSTRKVDHFTASAITQVHNALNDENKKKFADMVHKSPAHLAKASDFAFKHAK